ncbi:MAG: carboxypeptidase-like regulatory domain-containing protein, partial [Gemmatimonadaceae bacterium]|nr:carboxypeptidase-like regulatory domain-containing protein [Gemmatimonadaceae bacterium]
MILDFDVGSSFVLRGNSIKNNGLLFKPVIRAVATELTGSLTGSVRSTSATGPAVVGATVDVLKDGTALADTVSANVVASTSTDASGNYRFSFLLPGAYEVRATPPAGSGFQPALLPDGVTITSGATVADKVIVVVP